MIFLENEHNHDEYFCFIRECFLTFTCWHCPVFVDCFDDRREVDTVSFLGDRPNGREAAACSVAGCNAVLVLVVGFPS